MSLRYKGLRDIKLSCVQLQRHRREGGEYVYVREKL